jgi:ABC-type antimicrobial peptide transport system permease subunit
MRIPLRYNTRSLSTRWVASLLMIAAIALVVGVFTSVMALARGLEATLVATGSPENLVVLRHGSRSETQSAVRQEAYTTIVTFPEVARDIDGRPLAAGEVVVVVNMEKPRGGPSNVVLRGVTPESFALRPQVRLVEGRPPRPGLPEVAASRRLAERVLGTGLGGSVRIGSRDWRVVGLFEAGGTAFDSEIWADRGVLADEFKRYDYSAVVVRASDVERRDLLAARIAADPRLKLKAKPEPLFYEEQSLGAEPIRWVGMFVSVVMGLGGAVCGMNIMFGFVLSRAREIGIMRALGFSRWSIVLSFMVESIMVGLGGGLVGCILAYPMHGVHVGVMNYRTFSEVEFAFRVTWGLMGRGVVLGLGLSVVASVIPAVVAARAPISEALRAT